MLGQFRSVEIQGPLRTPPDVSATQCCCNEIVEKGAGSIEHLESSYQYDPGYH
jgi:hypothetical protein